MGCETEQQNLALFAERATHKEALSAGCFRAKYTTVKVGTERSRIPAGPPEPLIETVERRRYRWPWFLLAGVLLGICLAIVWISREVQRTRQYRDFNAPAATNGG
jgi:hypothetical protein